MSARVYRQLVVWLSCLAVVLSTTVLVRAQSDADAKYKQHMSNGVKLFQDKNYDAAIAEFQAAYKAKPKASPLVNIALSHKALFRYPKAITVLEDAVSKHADTLDAGDKKAAEDAIRELKSLLAYVTVKLAPPTASVLVDGEEQSKTGGASRSIPLGPGPHTIEARAEGYATKSEKITVASGERDRVIKLELVPDKGWVTIKAKDPATVIAIDQKAMSRGSWSGFLSPGTHVVQLYTAAGQTLWQDTNVSIVAGQATSIDEATTPSGSLSGPPPPGMIVMAPGQPQKPAEPPPPPKEGFYGLGIGIVNTSLGRFEPAGAGWSFGARGGWRPTTVVGLELSLAYAHTPTEGEATLLGQGAFDVDTYQGSIDSLRAGANLRLMTRGRIARFVATFGGGVSHNILSYQCNGCEDTSGTSGYGLLETGFEIDISGIFFGLTLQNLVSGLGTSAQPASSDVDVGDFGDFQGQVGLGLVGGYGTW